jgi:hypothetical protein
MGRQGRRRRRVKPSNFGPQIPKLCGADVELGNFVLGVGAGDDTCAEAAHALLYQIEGFPRRRWYQQQALAYTDSLGVLHITPGRTNPQDWGRRYLSSNGGCAYIDLNHLEICLPEVRSAWDHVAAWHAMLRIARSAQEATIAHRSSERRIQVLANNSDGRGNSYGSHLDFLVTRQAWDNIFERKLQYQLFLAAHQVSSIVYAGAGKVGSENRAPDATFQLSQRADFFERTCGTETTFNRPIVNARDEALCGRSSIHEEDVPADRMARLHVIFYDSTLSHVASLLKVGAMQIVLAMIEAECVPIRFALEDPLRALREWSRDPAMQVRAETVGGAHLTAVELQMRIVELARRFIDRGGCDGIVPRAREILSLWEETLTLLEAGDIATLAPRVDWALKLMALTRALDRRRDLDWGSPEIKYLDHLYSSLDPNEGLYWGYERSGLTQSVVSERDIDRFVSEPPADTRAWSRAHLMRLAGPDRIDDVDWDSIRFRLNGDGVWTRRRSFEMADPLAFTEADAASIVYSGADLETVLDALEELNERSVSHVTG